MKISGFLIAIILCAATGAHALEVTAGSRDTTILNASLDNKMETISAVVKVVTDGINVCTSKNMRFSPAAAGRDADNCIETRVTVCAKANKIYMPNSTTPVPDANGCVDNIANMMQVCNNSYKIYKPSSANPTPDANGCVDSPDTLCAKGGKIYLPNATGRDVNGCVVNTASLMQICASGNKVYMPNSTTPAPDGNGCVDPALIGGGGGGFTATCVNVTSSKTATCPAGYGMYALYNNGLTVSDKKWYATMRCCQFK